MLNEREAIEIKFLQIQEELKRLKEEYRQEVAELEKRQFHLLDRLQRLDDIERQEAAAETDATKARLANMTLPKNFVIRSLKRPEKKVTEIKAEDVQEAQQETAAAVEAPEKPAATVEKIIEQKLEIADPKNGVYTGVIENNEGEKRYQCFYECTNNRCRNKGKRFIPKEVIDTYCHNCGRSLRVKPATSAGWPQQDSFNNFFIAGARKTEEEMAAAYSAPAERVEQLLEDYNREREAAQEAQKEKTPSKPRRGRQPGTKNKELAPAAAAATKSKPDKLADPAPTPQIKEPQLVAGKKVIAKSEALIQELETILKEKGPQKAQELEKEIKARHGWEWANFYEAIRKAIDKHASNIFKDGRYYYLLEVKQDDGPHNIQQEAATV